MSVTAGIDFSSFAVDVVLIGEDYRVRWRRYAIEGGATAFDRTRGVRDAMPARTSEAWDEVTLVGIEEPAGPSSIVAPLKAVQGAILACLPNRLLVEPLQASRWRKLCGLSGSATKAAVAQWAAHELQLDAGDWPQDGWDAFCIAYAVSRMASREVAA